MANERPVTPEVVREHGLNGDEYDLILDIMGREPNLLELGIFSVMWSEHCSYKSSKKWLKYLPTSGPQVIKGPGENAGVIDIGEGLAAIFKMESHNHPSYIEPYQGAATGVGGILRDVFTMGARPVANLNALRFGAPDHPKTRHLVAGVVAGIGGYGNCVGVPTVAGETNFHPAYDGNILVNAMTVGVADADKIFYSAATGVGNPIVYVGSKTGRDGIHGATMASAEFGEDSEEKRPTVQVGDPFTEKLLIEACLELMATDAIVAIQDMGAAGLTSSSFEMASKGGSGVELELDKVPCREDGMTPYEMMLSESQERMLMVLRPEKEKEAEAIFHKWGLDFAIVGETTDDLRFRIKHEGEEVANLPIKELGDEAPEYDRPWMTPAQYQEMDAAQFAEPEDYADALKRIVGAPNMASRRWVWEQYDTLIQGNSLQLPGGDAGVVRVDGHETKALAFSSDVTPRYCEADPFEGGKQAVAECWRNITATGAEPLAATDNLNFGNPQRPEIMGQLVRAIEGIGEACTALGFPIVSGNVSLYNETNGEAILPTPTIAGVGLLPDYSVMARVNSMQDGDTIFLLGGDGTHLGQSIFNRIVNERMDGPPPPVDLYCEKRNGDFVRSAIRNGQVTACHDLSDGGMLVALAEMCIASGKGATIDAGDAGPAHALLFGEDQGRYLVTVNAENARFFALNAEGAGVPFRELGAVGGEMLSLTAPVHVAISVTELAGIHESWFPEFMDASRHAEAAE